VPRTGRAAIVALGLFAMAATACQSATKPAAPTSAPTSAATPATPTGTPTLGDKTIGPLFATGLNGHYCTASVVHSPGHDLLITAGHCVTGVGTGVTFAPGYHDGVSPYGTWVVVRAYADAKWRTNHDPLHDVAFLQVAKQIKGTKLVGIEDVVGANSMGTAPPTHATVTVTGYVLGSNDKPTTCAPKVYYTDVWPSFDCGGFADGTSGGPWLRAGQIDGVIGGLHQGGCTPDTSYSAPFGADVTALYQRAIAAGAGDLVTPAVSDGC
jgi:V8-like Glu-specific endopeptidase